MPSYSYKAVNGAGATVSGVVTAENYQVALRMLDEQSLYPVKVDEGLESGTFKLSGRRIKTQHLTTFYSQLADLLKAGVPMLRSLDVLSKQKTGGRFSQIVKELREDVAGGIGLGEGMSKHPLAFSNLQSSMVRAGEQGGFLEEVLERIAIFSEKQDELRNKVVGAMIYPCILVGVGGLVIGLLMTVVVPKLGQYLRPESFNIMTHIVFGLCNILLNYWPWLILSFVTIVSGFVTLKRTDYGHRKWEHFKLKAPVIGHVMTMVAICRFCRILGTMLRNGVSILQALKISKDSAGNLILAELIEQAADNVRKGEPLSTPLGQSGLFPPTVVDMIAVAEESNNLDTVLVQIADTNEARTARAIDLSVRIIEPILLVVMAGVVFSVAIAILLPIMSMGSNIGN